MYLHSVSTNALNRSDNGDHTSCYIFLSYTMPIIYYITGNIYTENRSKTGLFKVKILFVIALGLSNCFKQIRLERLLRTSVPIYELWSNISTMHRL